MQVLEDWNIFWENEIAAFFCHAEKGAKRFTKNRIFKIYVLMSPLPT